jgi:hypothetical protein
MRATVFIDGRVYDQFDAPERAFVPFYQVHQAWEQTDDDWFRPHNWAYFDPVRADVWGRVAVDPELPWWTIRNLRASSSAWDGALWIIARTPGSLCDPHELLWPDFVNYSGKLAEREFQIHMRTFHEHRTNFTGLK